MIFGISKFQTVFIAVILVIVCIALYVFAFKKSGSGGQDLVKVQVWGQFPKATMTEVVSKFNMLNKGFYELEYTAFGSDPDDYEKTFVDLLASGQAPEYIIISQDLVLKHRDKFSVISFERMPERTFRDAFLDESELFVTQNGIIAVPFMVDPIVLYWNKDLFSKAGIVSPPKTWTDFSEFSANGKLTELDRANNIIQSGAALGEFSNVKNAKEIISLLILQTGNPIIESKNLQLKFGTSELDDQTTSVASAVRFYTEFANPNKVYYSWNRGMPNSKDAFISGRLAMYFGYASEIQDIRDKNPHLNFDVTTVPQIKNSNIQATYGKMYALAIPKASKQPAAAVDALFKIAASPDILDILGKQFHLPPASRVLLSRGNKDPEMTVFYKSAIQSKGWLEPNAEEVSAIFKDMIESISTGKKGIQEAVITASTLINKELSKIK